MENPPNFPRTIYYSECAIFLDGLIKTGLMPYGVIGLQAGDIDLKPKNNK